MNCPFYGRAMYQKGVFGGTPFLLLNTEGNQCAIVIDSHAPCMMEIAADVPDWRTCPLVRDLRMEGDTGREEHDL